MNKNTKWLPEIMYEDDPDGQSSVIPFIIVPQEQVMPQVLFIFESRDTGRIEPGNDGYSMPIYEMDLHQYADMVVLKDELDEETYDKVRVCLGLEPWKIATIKGKKITENIKKNLGQ